MFDMDGDLKGSEEEDTGGQVEQSAPVSPQVMAKQHMSKKTALIVPNVQVVVQPDPPLSDGEVLQLLIDDAGLHEVGNLPGYSIHAEAGHLSVETSSRLGPHIPDRSFVLRMIALGGATMGWTTNHGSPLLHTQ